MRDGDAPIAARMRADWDERARVNARHYVATHRETWTDEEFFASGQRWIDQFVAPDLVLLGREPPVSALRMLEIGCGAGRMTKGLGELFGSVDAVDISPEMIARARDALKGSANVRFHVNDGRSLSMFGVASFDYAFSGLVFQHIPRKAIVEHYVGETARVLRPGGVFKCQVQGLPVREADANTWTGAGFAAEDMRSMAGRCGFEVHSATGAGTQYFWLVLVKAPASNATKSHA